MPGRCFLPALLLGVMVFLQGMPQVPATAYGERTFDQETCSLCHIRDSVYIDPSYLSVGMGEIFTEERLCMSCHNGSVLDHRRSLWRGEQHPAIPAGANDREKPCSGCHSPHEKGGWEVLRRTAVRLSGGGDPLCTGCHKAYGSRSAGLHEPGFPNGGCAECHQVHGGTGNVLLRAPKESICHRCHEDQGRNRSGGHPVATLKGGKSLRVALPGCTDCHPVHRPPPGDSVERRCAECHEADLGSPNPEAAAHRPGETCLSCHSFHSRSGAGGKGLRKSDMEPSVLCGKCHGEVIATGLDEAKRRGTHPVEGRRGKERLCLRCHRIHKAAPDTPMLATNKAYFCLECHEEQNTIRETQGILLAHPVFERVAEGRLAAAAKANRLVLGPTGEIVCSTCHSIHRSVPGSPLLEKGFDQAGNCFLCHEALRGARHRHSADRAREPGCASCHKVHGMRTGKGDPWGEVCSACHLQQMAHLAGKEDRKIHRPEGMPGFDERGRAVEVGGEISCPTCHEPHGTSEIPKMFRKPYRSSGFLCTACHREKETVALTPHDLRGIAGDGICEPCHEPHGGSYPWMWGMKREEGDPAEESCRSCHREGGLGFPVPDGGHPSGMIVVRPQPDRFPLYGQEWKVSRSGVLTCSTCHQIHGDVSAPRGGDRNPLLRSALPFREGTTDDEAFCRTCHPQGKVSHGKAGCSACHPTHPKRRQAESCDACHSALAGGIADLHLRKGTSCRDCHRIHGDGGTAMLESRCTACHTRTERIRGTPHAERGGMICEPCHPSHRELDTTAAGRHSYEEIFRPDESCLRCHNEQGIGPVPGWMEHPKARREVPTNYGTMVILETPIHMIGRLTEGNRPLFPLFDADGNRSLSGRMGCLTCHDPHLGTIGKTGEAGRSVSGYLRDPSGIFLSEICVPCHRNESGKHVISFHKLPRKTE